jgi:hypothetical protein
MAKEGFFDSPIFFFKGRCMTTIGYQLIVVSSGPSHAMKADWPEHEGAAILSEDKHA